MDWFRGGEWESDGDQLRLLPHPPVPGSIVGRLISHFEQFSSEREAWLRDVGRPSRLETYALTPTIGRTILEEYHGLTAGVRPESLTFSVLFPNDPVEPARTDLWGEPPNATELEALKRGMCALLARWGPLGEVNGVFDLGSPMPTGQEKATYFLFCFLEMRALAASHEEIEARPRGDARLELGKRLNDRSKKALRDLEVVPTFRDGGVTYDARPLTLRAYLWRLLFGRYGRTVTGFCRYCEKDFEIEGVRGQPPKYCPEHRAGKYRQAVSTANAPRHRSTGVSRREAVSSEVSKSSRARQKAAPR